MDPFSGVSGVSHLFFADDFVLFAEATLDQVAVVQRILQEFCGASGHKEKVNVIKEKWFCSCNVMLSLSWQVCIASTETY